MFLGEPQSTPYDVRFNLLGFNVRVHPMFWLMALIFSVGDGRPDPLSALVGIPVIFVSILVHELGHAVAIRYYGDRARIALYAFGGLAIPESDVFSFVSKRSRSPIQQIVISAAGPAAGFSLGVIAALLVLAAGGELHFQMMNNVIPAVFASTENTIFDSPAAFLTINMTLYIAVVWTALNLLPVYPLDGGQIARELFVMQNPWKGIQNSLYLSLIVAGGLALLGFSQRQLFLGLLFASLAYSNWQVLQQLSGGGFGGGGFGGGGGGFGRRGPW